MKEEISDFQPRYAQVTGQMFNCAAPAETTPYLEIDHINDVDVNDTRLYQDFQRSYTVFIFLIRS